MTQPNHIILHPNACSQEFHYIHLRLDRCVKSCNTLNKVSNKVCVPNKTEDLSMFPLVTGINESETLKQISCECICRFGRKICYSDQWWSNDKC